MSAEERPVVTLWRVPGDSLWAAYPWRFRIEWKGATYNYWGVPNYCRTKREAAVRAAWRVRWMLDGSYARRYR